MNRWLHEEPVMADFYVHRVTRNASIFEHSPSLSSPGRICTRTRMFYLFSFERDSQKRKFSALPVILVSLFVQYQSKRTSLRSASQFLVNLQPLVTTLYAHKRRLRSPSRYPCVTRRRIEELFDQSFKYITRWLSVATDRFKRIS